MHREELKTGGCVAVTFAVGGVGAFSVSFGGSVSINVEG